MGQVLHGCAKTIEVMRWAIQKNQENLKILERRYDINPKIVRKWKKFQYVSDSRMDPKEARSTVLNFEEEGVCADL